MLHLIAKIFEGEASIAEELSAMTYAALPLWLLIPTALVWMVAGGAGPDGHFSWRIGDDAGRAQADIHRGA